MHHVKFYLIIQNFQSRLRDPNEFQSEEAFYDDGGRSFRFPERFQEKGYSAVENSRSLEGLREEENEDDEDEHDDGGEQEFAPRPVVITFEEFKEAEGRGKELSLAFEAVKATLKETKERYRYRLVGVKEVIL